MLFLSGGFSFTWLFICLTVTTAYSQSINPRFAHFTINDGLSQSLVYAITQGPQGFMWFGTKDGLDRFDGYEFKTYYHDPFDPSSISGNAVSALFTDSKGRLWIGTLHGGLDLYDRDNDWFIHYLASQMNGATINVITEDSSGNLWVGTYGNGIFELIFNPKDGKALKKVRHYVHQQRDSISLHDNFVIDLFADHEGKLWVSTNTGMFQFVDLKAQKTRFYTPQFTISKVHKEFVHNGIQFDTTKTTPNKLNNLTFDGGKFIEDQRHRLWIGTSSGLFLLDKGDKLLYFDPLMPGLKRANIQSMCKVTSDKGKEASSLWLGFYRGVGVFNIHTFAFQLIKSDPGNSKSLLPGHVMSIYQDRSGCIWLGSNGYGLSKYNSHSILFPLPEYHTADGSIRTKSLSVRSFLDTKNYLLIGTINGLMVADKNTHLMKRILFRESPGAANVIFSIVYADSESCWIGTNYGLVWYNFDNNTFKTFMPDINKGGQIDNRIFKIFNDRRGNLWCLTPYSLSLFDIKPKTFRNYFFNHKPTNEYLEPTYGDIYEAPSGNFWLGTGEGLLYFDTSQKRFHHYVTDPSDPHSLSFNAVRSVLPDPQHPHKYLWIGTAGGGLNKFNLHTKKFTHYTVKDGLPNNVVYGILPGPQGDLWMSTNDGLSRFDPSTRKFQNYNVQSGLQSNEFNSGAFYENKKGKLFFGGIKGFNAFSPEKIKGSSYIPQVVFTRFDLFSHPITIYDKNSPLKYPITETRKITLAHNDNIISFRIAALDYSNPGKNKYAYKLTPSNESWIQMGTSRLITFNNLNPGHYVLHVKAANSNGLWNQKGISLSLAILPPWWKTWWAYLFYFLIFALALYFVRQYESKRISLRNWLQIEHVEAQKLKELDHLKSRFFANISHEFRTPLTLIIGPLEDFMQGGGSEKLTSFVPKMHRNSKRLLQLINQLLDLSKLDSNSYKINTSREDIIPYVRQIVHSFSSLAKRRNINLGMKVDTALRENLENQNIRFYFDEDMIEKILNNLLSNAFKFTPEDGAIIVSLGRAEKKKGFLEVKVKDSGIGIPEEKLPHIFDRFYQADDPGKKRFEGSGVGLALLKELVDLLHGEIFVESQSGRGATFYCYLPFNKRIVSEKRTTEHIPSSDREIIPEDEITEAEAETLDADKSHILLVEDHKEVRKYIRGKLEASYSVTEAKNGKEGLEKAFRQIPDLVISDVMMPEMDGFEVCKRLKTNDLTSHIPVILVTARAEDADKLQGLETGADAYLIKPFNAKELNIRVGKLIKLRNGMRAKFSNKLIVKPSEVTVTSRDKEFMERLLSIVEQHIDDAQFSVVQLGSQMNMSASQLNRKLKGLINQTPQKFMRSVRMQRALDMLKGDAGGIAEIAWKVGFEDPGYFTKVFKQQFDCLPSEPEKFP
jgi:signal transduction histidine kinase/ligand-binding sensor domain-containing protein/DNA-binding response OmpR family regulator